MFKQLLVTILLIFYVYPDTRTKSIEIVQAQRVVQHKDKILILGPAIIKKDNVLISANLIEYNFANDTLSMRGNVLINHKGEIYTADSAILTDKMTKGKLQNINALLKHNYRIATKTLTLDLKNKSSASYCTFSTCNNPSKTSPSELLWTIKAKKVTYDKESETIIYDNPQLEFKGIPLIRLRQFSHPSHKVKRKSGFLCPKIIISKNLGLIVIPKYYWSISESSELILKPTIIAKDSILWGSFSKLFRNASIELTGSYQPFINKNRHIANKVEKDEFKKIKDRGYRGHLKGKVLAELNENTNFFSNISTVSDKSYLSVYSFLDNRKNDFSPGSNLEESNIGVEHYYDNSYSILKSVTYQNVRIRNTSYKTPAILPFFENIFYKKYDILTDGFFYSDLIVMNIDYKNSKKDSKFFWNGGYISYFKTKNGQLLSINLSLIANAYKLRNSAASGTKNLTRLYPMLIFDYSYPLLVYCSNGIKNIFSPKIQTIFSPRFKEKYQDYIENSDLVFNYLELNENNIFNENKTSKMNQINTGNKIIYGIESSFYKDGFNFADYFIAQSHNFSKKMYQIPYETGTSYMTSSIVSGGNIYLNNSINFGTKLNFNRKLKNLLRYKIYSNINYSKNIFSLGIISGKHFSIDKAKNKFHNMFLSLGRKINSTSSIVAKFILGPGNSLIKASCGIMYEDECFISNISIEHTRYRKIDSKPDLKISFAVYLKGINYFKK